MTHYYFDLRSGDELAPDDDGMEMSTIDHAREEAYATLFQLAREIDPFLMKSLAVEVRDELGAVFHITLVFKMDRLN